jgi:tetratricopeptide (TPR) repeat protein
LAVVILLVLLGAGAVVATPHLRAWHHLRVARSELQRWHNAQAIRHLKICMEVWPHDPNVLLLAARSSRRARSYTDAERLLEMYRQERGLDEASSFEQLLLSAGRGKEQVMNTCWRYVEQGHPDAPLILEALTFGHLGQYRLGEARSCLDYWLQQFPDHPQALCLEGLFFLDYGHARSAAEKSYRRVLELDPEHEEARLGLAVALLDDNNFDEAAEHLEYLRQCQPDGLSIQVGLAECYYGLGKQEEAEGIVESVLAANPDFVPALSLRGRLALKSGQSVEAENWLQEAVRLNPNDFRARFALVQALHHNGKENDAQEQQNQVKQLEKDLIRFNEIVTNDLVKQPRDPALHCELGQLLLRSGQHEKGLQYLQSALRLDPQCAPARQALAELKEKSNTRTRQAESEQPPR